MKMSEMPRGYRFNPTEEDLLYYLAEKVKGNPFPDAIDGVIIKKDVYGGKAPWELFKDNDPWQTPVDSLGMLGKPRSLYVITTKLQKTAEKNNTDKTAGCGVWKIAGRKLDKIQIDDKHVGFMSKFRFIIENRRTPWVMYEYELQESHSGNLVICRITRIESPELDVQETGSSGNNENVQELGKGKSVSEDENRFGVKIQDKQSGGNDGLPQKQEGEKSVSGNLEDLCKGKSVSGEENACGIPRGYRFNPSEEDLLYYVQLKEKRIPLPDAIKGVIIEKDVHICAKNVPPWLLFNDNYPWRKPVAGCGMISDDKILDVITKLLKKNNSKRNKRKMAIVSPASSGIWKRRGNKSIENSKGEEIGTRTLFTFEFKKKSVDNGIWRMYQYKFNVSNEFVICRMKKTKAKSMPESSKTGDQENTENVEDLGKGNSGSAQEENPVGEEIHNEQQEGNDGVSKKTKKDHDFYLDFCPPLDDDFQDDWINDYY